MSADTIVGGVLISLSLCALVTAAVCVVDASCGKRCTSCDERMCGQYGPEPGACGEHCEDHGDGCMECSEIAADLQADIDFDYERGA